MLRGFGSRLEGKVRLNAVVPSWTDTGIIAKEFVESLGISTQEPVVVARSVVHLFGNQKCHVEAIYSMNGNYWEINKAEQGLLRAVENMLPDAGNEEAVMQKIAAMAAAG